MPHLTHTLPCGLRIVYESNKSPVLHLGYVVCAGTRHEDAADTGMAHFLEHISFKGTQRRTARQIANGLESVGGELNAYTTKQETVYYATALRRDFRRAADLLTDIVFHSTYPQAEIDKEVEVICDEIDSYRDAPAELIFDDFEARMYPGQSLGRDILGDKERLRSYTTADALRFARQWYRPENAVFYVYGAVPFAQVVRTLEQLLPAADFAPLSFSIDKAPSVPPMPRSEGETQEVKKDTHQAHVMLGGAAYDGHHPRRYALILLNNLLGGPGMNSRLNLKLREQYALVYSIDSYLNTYPDAGFWNVYFGCDPEDVERCLQLVHRELRKLATQPLTPRELRAAQKQLCGQLVIASANAESYALSMGKTFAHYGLFRNVPDLCSHINAVTAEEVLQAAAEVYAPERLCALIYR